jgi:FkbM family methyltransferase
LGRNYYEHPELELPPPYDATQLDVERHLHEYLHVSPSEIGQIVIVGTHEGGEVQRLRSVYSRANFLCFEPNPPVYQDLALKFAGLSYVRLSDLALSDVPGKTRFYELDMPGNGSLLEPDVKDWAQFTHWKGESIAAFDVTVSTLDREAAGLAAIDLLWMDVQGAEGAVLGGGVETLKRTRAVFIEVALTHSPYKGAELFPQIQVRLNTHGFVCVGLGVDVWNASGNAFFVKDFEGRDRRGGVQR